MLRSVLTGIVNRIVAHRRFLAYVGLGILAGVLAVLLLSGCQSSSTITPGSTSLRSVERVTTTDPATGATVTREREAIGTATGAGARASGDKIDQDVSSTAPKLTVPGATASAGGFDSDTAATSDSARWIVLGLGVLCLFAGGAGIYFGVRALAIVGGAVGALLIVAGIYPALLLWLLLAGIAVGGAYAVWAGLLGAKAQSALAAVVAGVETAPADVAAAVKAEIAKQATAADKAVITTTKAKEGV